jgi:cell division protein FtsB
MALWHIVVGLMTFWIIVLLFMGSTLHQSSDVTEQVERQLFEANQKLDGLRKENRQLKRIAADLK